MYGWIVYFRNDSIRNKEYIRLYEEEGKRKGVTIKLVHMEDMEYGTQLSVPYLRYCGKDIGKEMMQPEFVINRSIYPLFSQHLESMGIPVFNNSHTATICNNKAYTYEFALQRGVDAVDSDFCMNALLEGRHRLGRIKAQSVIKSAYGHGGSQVFLYESAEDQDGFHKIMDGINGDDVIIQPLIKGKGQDLRVYVIGEEITAAVLRTANNGFRSNYSLGGGVERYTLTQEERAIVKKLVQNAGFHFVGIDFILEESGRLLFNEIEDVVGSRMLYQCSDINIVKDYIEYILTVLTPAT